MRIIAKSISLVRAADGVVAHQCNCLTRGAAKGVAATIFRAFPYADIYKKRSRDDIPGAAVVKRPFPAMQGYPVVVNLLSQRYPGPAERDDDTPEERLAWLHLALTDAVRQLGGGIHKIFIPYKMAAGMAGGDWSRILKVLERHERNGIEFALCLW